MKFVIGGQYSGKLNYTLNLFNLLEEQVASGEESDIDQLIKSPVINNFHLLIKRLLIEDDNAENVINKINSILEKNKNVIIISNEIGYGIVPIDKFDRKYRELVGRICCNIAREATEVHRVISGIGEKIK